MKIISENRKVTAILLSLALMLSAVYDRHYSYIL